MTSVPFPTAEEVAELLRCRSLASDTGVCVERRDDNDGSMDYIVHGRDGDFASCSEHANENAMRNADFLALLLCLSGKLLASASFALKAEAFLREHGPYLAGIIVRTDMSGTLSKAYGELMGSMLSRSRGEADG